MKWIVASKSKLVPLLTHEYGDDADKIADKIRAVWKADKWGELELVCPEELAQYEKTVRYGLFREAKQYIINMLLKTYGVETLGIRKRNGKTVTYCNAGDTYVTTILFEGARLFTGCWGDLVEHNLIREY